MSDAKIGYAAGFIDGEGCLRISRNGAIEVTVVNSSHAALEFLQNLFGGSVSERKRHVNKPLYNWRIYGAKAIDVLRRVEPFLIDKKSQALFMVQYFENRPASIRTPGRGRGYGRQRNPAVDAAVTHMRELKHVST